MEKKGKSKKSEKVKRVKETKREHFLAKFFGKKIAKEKIASESLKSIKFLTAFLAVFILLNAVIYFVPMEVLERPIADALLSYLQINGYEGKIIEQTPVLIELVNGVKIEISYLCTGLLEMIVLISAIIASLGISWRKRLLGIVVGVGLTQAFNLMRIIITTDLILRTDSIEIIEFVHNFLFRLTLFIVIVGIYAAWFYWATKKVKKKI